MSENQTFFSKRLNDLNNATTKLISHDEMWERIEIRIKQRHANKSSKNCSSGYEPEELSTAKDSNE